MGSERPDAYPSHACRLPAAIQSTGGRGTVSAGGVKKGRLLRGEASLDCAPKAAIPEIQKFQRFQRRGSMSGHWAVRSGRWTSEPGTTALSLFETSMASAESSIKGGNWTFAAIRMEVSYARLFGH